MSALTCQHRTAPGYSIWLMADPASLKKYTTHVARLLTARNIQPFPIHIPLIGGFTHYMSAKTYLRDLAQHMTNVTVQVDGCGFDTKTSVQYAYLRIDESLSSAIQSLTAEESSVGVQQPLVVCVGYRHGVTRSPLSVFDIGQLIDGTFSIPCTQLAVWKTTGPVTDWVQTSERIPLREGTYGSAVN